MDGSRIHPASTRVSGGGKAPVMARPQASEKTIPRLCLVGNHYNPLLRNRRGGFYGRALVKEYRPFRGQATMSKIIAVSRSKKKGTRKNEVKVGLLEEDYGLAGDAHADCCTHRQVSLLAIESINKMRKLGFDVGPGDFAENLTTEGVDLISLPVGTCISIGEGTMLEVTQIGKECHSGCAIYRQIGKCIMPKEGVFARVIRGGFVKAGDSIKVADQGRRG